MRGTSKTGVVDTYRGYAPIYDFAFGRVLEAGRRGLAEALARYRPQRLLEVGVGTGLALHRYPSDAAVVGLDLSAAMLARARRAVRKSKLDHVQLLQADAEQLPFADASFDCIALPYVLSVTPDPAALLAELRRVCTLQGHVFVLNHFRGAGAWGWAERLLAPLADRVGFRSTLPLEPLLESPLWSTLEVRPVNLGGLSRLVVLRAR